MEGQGPGLSGAAFWAPRALEGSPQADVLTADTGRLYDCDPVLAGLSGHGCRELVGQSPRDGPRPPSLQRAGQDGTGHARRAGLSVPGPPAARTAVWHHPALQIHERLGAGTEPCVAPRQQVDEGKCFCPNSAASNFEVEEVETDWGTGVSPHTSHPLTAFPFMSAVCRCSQLAQNVGERGFPGWLSN